LKKKLTVTIDEDLIPEAKRYARSKGVSLSQLIEGALREMSAAYERSFSRRWRGEFQAVDRDDDRYKRLAEKYLDTSD
jgi:post-segregation antitoxin (ccd killing protein)